MLKRVIPYFLFTVEIYAQVSGSAYRALGQPDLRQTGVNMVQGPEMYSPYGVALDARGGALRLYVADTRNHRVLAWPDVSSYQIGDAPAVILGQPGPQYSAPLGIGAKGFNAPLGLAVDPGSGNLYVADYGNNRVLRFPSPFANPTRVEPDMVYGQAGFSGGGANASGVSSNSMNQPRAVAFDSAGNLWVADSGNNRILRFNAAALDTVNPGADIVVGQAGFSSGGRNGGGNAVSASGFDLPTGLAFDQRNNLYVSDFNNGRVLKFAAPVGTNAAAVTALGQSDLVTGKAPLQASASTLAGPAGLTLDSAGNLYVAVPKDNRILSFPANAVSGAAAQDVLGQADFSSTAANASSFPYASAGGLSGVTDVKADPNGNLFAADTGNNRVISFPRGAKTANQLWGQTDFSSNGANQIKPGSINAPFKIAVDYSQPPYALYVSDTNNNRILVWKDGARFRSGDPADMVIGQPDLMTALANVDSGGAQKASSMSLSSPKGIAVDGYGNLYVADSGNNRVLRFSRPVSQSGRIAADNVIGQPDFSASSSGLSALSLNAPSGAAIGPDGDLFVADSGNNRVLEFPNGAGAGTAAIRVYGQPDFTTAISPGAVSAQTLTSPQGIFVDSSDSLYVADTGANRVLVFPSAKDAAPAASAAAVVIGQAQFNSAGAGGGPTGLRGPSDVALDSSGNVYVSDTGNNRVLSFPSLLFLPLSGGSAVSATGQASTSGSAPNWNSTDGRATAEGLSGPLGIFVDRLDTLYVADAGNSRVTQFLKSASVLQAANPQSGIPLAQGALATVYGAGLSDSDQVAPGVPLPLALGNREIAINDTLTAPLSYAGANQINFQVPSSAPLGSDRIAVRLSDTGELIAGTTAAVAAASPGLFSADASGKGLGKILNQDGTANSATNPAAKGSTIQIFGTGQGPVSPAVPDGAAAPASPPANTIAAPTSDGVACLSRQPSVCVAVGTTFGDVQFSGLAPGAVGVWQLTVKLPDNVASGNAVPLRAVINGNPSNIVSVAIK